MQCLKCPRLRKRVYWPIRGKVITEKPFISTHRPSPFSSNIHSHTGLASQLSPLQRNQQPILEEAVCGGCVFKTRVFRPSHPQVAPTDWSITLGDSSQHSSQWRDGLAQMEKNIQPQRGEDCEHWGEKRLSRAFWEMFKGRGP